MKRIYYPYWKWEDYKNGMFDLSNKTEKETEIQTKQARILLSNPKEFFEVGLSVINNWKHSTELNLSNKSRNRQAWIGQASCCYKHKIPEYITKYGWRLLTIEQQTIANIIADKIINIWEMKKCQKNT